jgi:prepilin-type N-terminal cleavage/methylation domain-containing protein
MNRVKAINLIGWNKWIWGVRIGNLEQGYTLIEMIVGLLIVGVLGALAFPSWLSFWQRQQVRKAASQLQAALQLVKSTATKNSVRYALTACSHSMDSGLLKGISYSVHPYSQRPYEFMSIEGVSIVQSTVRRSPVQYHLPSSVYGDCYTAYLGLFPGDGYALGFFYLSNGQGQYVHRVGFNTLIGHVVSCPIKSLKTPRCR